MFYLKPPRHISTLPIASICPSADDFRSSPGSGHRRGRSACLKSARKRLVHCNKLHRYSITSAWPSNDSGRRGRSTAPLPLCRGPRWNRRGDPTVDLAWKTSNGGCHAELARELDEGKIL